ncbi:hypothetical protein MHYP_G00244340 [Metynnis hypsauchen]
MGELGREERVYVGMIGRARHGGMSSGDWRFPAPSLARQFASLGCQAPACMEGSAGETQEEGRASRKHTPVDSGAPSMLRAVNTIRAQYGPQEADIANTPTLPPGPSLDGSEITRDSRHEAFSLTSLETRQIGTTAISILPL